MASRGADKVYNRYIPVQARYEAAVPPQNRQKTRGVASSNNRPSGGLGSLFSGLTDGMGYSLSQAVSSVLKSFHLDDLDLGDILLALIVLLLILEDGDSLDVIITLGLMLLFSLGEK